MNVYSCESEKERELARWPGIDVFVKIGEGKLTSPLT